MDITFCCICHLCYFFHGFIICYHNFSQELSNRSLLTASSCPGVEVQVCEKTKWKKMTMEFLQAQIVLFEGDKKHERGTAALNPTFAIVAAVLSLLSVSQWLLRVCIDLHTCLYSRHIWWRLVFSATDVSQSLTIFTFIQDDGESKTSTYIWEWKKNERRISRTKKRDFSVLP